MLVQNYRKSSLPCWTHSFGIRAPISPPQKKEESHLGMDRKCHTPRFPTRAKVEKNQHQFAWNPILLGIYSCFRFNLFCMRGNCRPCPSLLFLRPGDLSFLFFWGATEKLFPSPKYIYIGCKRHFLSHESSRREHETPMIPKYQNKGRNPGFVFLSFWLKPKQDEAKDH